MSISAVGTDERERRRELAEASCREVQHGSHIDSMPTHAALAPNERPLMLRDDDVVVIALSEYLRSQKEFS